MSLRDVFGAQPSKYAQPRSRPGGEFPRPAPAAGVDRADAGNQGGLYAHTQCRPAPKVLWPPVAQPSASVTSSFARGTSQRKQSKGSAGATSERTRVGCKPGKLGYIRRTSDQGGEQYRMRPSTSRSSRSTHASPSSSPPISRSSMSSSRSSAMDARSPSRWPTRRTSASSMT